MAWTKKQKQIAAQAARHAGLDDEHRKLVLRQFPRSLFDRAGHATGEPSSTSQRLTQSDFEHYMAIIERSSGGQVTGYERGYWVAKAKDDLTRLRYRSKVIAIRLQQAGLMRTYEDLRHWIRTRGVSDRTDFVDELDYVELVRLVNGLRAYAKRNHVSVE